MSQIGKDTGACRIVAGSKPCTKVSTGSERGCDTLELKPGFPCRIFLCRESIAILKQKRIESCNNNNNDNSNSLKAILKEMLKEVGVSENSGVFFLLKITK